MMFASTQSISPSDAKNIYSRSCDRAGEVELLPIGCPGTSHLDVIVRGYDAGRENLRIRSRRFLTEIRTDVMLIPTSNMNEYDQ